MFERNKDLERKQLAPGVYITSRGAAKFNRCRITLHLRFPARSGICHRCRCAGPCLERGYAACPDMTALSRRLAELYGADLGVDLSSAGHRPRAFRRHLRHQGRLRTGGENLTDAYADIVFGTIFDPYLVDGASSTRGRAH